jgi:hypothetical protein
VRGGCRTGKIIDAVDLKLEGVDHVMTDELEARITQKVLDVGFPTREEVVEADHLMTLLNQSITEMGTKESSTTGNENTHVGKVKG